MNKDYSIEMLKHKRCSIFSGKVESCLLAMLCAISHFPGLWIHGFRLMGTVECPLSNIDPSFTEHLRLARFDMAAKENYTEESCFEMLMAEIKSRPSITEVDCTATKQQISVGFCLYKNYPTLTNEQVFDMRLNSTFQR